MSGLAFLSPSRCAPGVELASPLRRALAGADPERVRDLSLTPVLELRGELASDALPVEGELVRLTPRRAFLFPGGDAADAARRLRAAGVLAYDASGALAGLEIAGERVMRRLTDLDLDRLPAAGPVAGVWALVLPGGDGRYRVFVHQELGHYVAEAVLDALAGVEANP
ncbi:MAG TPA: hypothetical protein VNJ46_02555 [Gaiellaceae bacterium]|nr:hypothetical protein [Gaiellaceae bacterium]